MPIKLQWHNPSETVIFMALETPWTWETYHHAVEEMMDVLHHTDRRVDIIIDLRNMGPLPKDTVMQLSHSFYRPEANVGVCVLVGVTPHLRKTLDIAQNVYDLAAAERPLAFADTLEEAQNTVYAPAEA